MSEPNKSGSMVLITITLKQLSNIFTVEYSARTVWITTLGHVTVYAAYGQSQARTCGNWFQFLTFETCSTCQLVLTSPRVTAYTQSHTAPESPRLHVTVRRLCCSAQASYAVTHVRTPDGRTKLIQKRARKF